MCVCVCVCVCVCKNTNKIKTCIQVGVLIQCYDGVLIQCYDKNTNRATRGSTTHTLGGPSPGADTFQGRDVHARTDPKARARACVCVCVCVCVRARSRTLRLFQMVLTLIVI